MRSSESIAEIAGALVLANADLRNPLKDSKANVGKFSYEFASLPSILDEVRPVLTKNGLAAVQEDVTTPDGIGVVTRLLHTSGEWIEFGPLLMPRSNDAQANGSILSYCRRYQLTAALGLAPDEDDDGRSATHRAAPGGSTATPNTGKDHESVPSPRDGNGAQAARDNRVAPGSVAAPPSLSASDGSTRADGAPAGDDPTVLRGEGGTTPAGAPHYLSKDDQGLLAVQHGSRVAALKAYQARFGSRITRLGDITYEMRDEMEGANA